MPKRRLLRKFFLILVITIVIVVVVGVLFLNYANKVVKAQLESALGTGFSVREIKLSWGEVAAFHILLKNKEGRTVLAISDLRLQANFRSLLRREFCCSYLAMSEPYVFMEIDPQGKLINPSLPGVESREKAKRPLPAVIIEEARIVNGSLDYLDRQPPAGPVFIKVRNMDVKLHHIAFPSTPNSSLYAIDAQVLGTREVGKIRSKGKIKLTAHGIEDMESTIAIRDLDIVPFRPYFQKKGEVTVTQGFLHLDMEVKVHNRKLNAPGRAVLRGLEFESGPGMGNKFLGLPLAMAIAILKNKNNEITVDFVLDGDLNNPHFHFRESIVRKLSLAIASKLGISIKEIGKSVVETGTEGVKKGVQSIKELFQN